MSTSDFGMLPFLTSSSPRFSCAAVLVLFASALASSACRCMTTACKGSCSSTNKRSPAATSAPSSNSRCSRNPVTRARRSTESTADDPAVELLAGRDRGRLQRDHGHRRRRGRACRPRTGRPAARRPRAAPRPRSRAPATDAGLQAGLAIFDCRSPRGRLPAGGAMDGPIRRRARLHDARCGRIAHSGRRRYCSSTSAARRATRQRTAPARSRRRSMTSSP